LGFDGRHAMLIADAAIISLPDALGSFAITPGLPEGHAGFRISRRYARRLRRFATHAARQCPPITIPRAKGTRLAFSCWLPDRHEDDAIAKSATVRRAVPAHRQRHAIT